MKKLLIKIDKYSYVDLNKILKYSNFAQECGCCLTKKGEKLIELFMKEFGVFIKEKLNEEY